MANTVLSSCSTHTRKPSRPEVFRLLIILITHYTTQLKNKTWRKQLEDRLLCLIICYIFFLSTSPGLSLVDPIWLQWHVWPHRPERRCFTHFRKLGKRWPQQVLLLFKGSSIIAKEILDTFCGESTEIFYLSKSSSSSKITHQAEWFLSTIIT